MPGWNNYDRPLQPKPAIGTGATDSLPNDRHRLTQKLDWPGKQSGKQAAPEEMKAFTQIFRDCDPKAKSDPDRSEPKPAHARSDESRKPSLDEKKSACVRDRDASRLHREACDLSQNDAESIFDGYASSTGSRDDGEGGESLSDETPKLDAISNDGVSVASFWVQSMPTDTDVVPIAPSSDIEEFMALVERNVERLALAATSNENAANQVMISLTGRVFQQTSLLLTRTPSGWSLKTMGMSDENLARIKRHAPGLVERFAERGLGSLEFDLIEPVWRQ